MVYLFESEYLRLLLRGGADVSDIGGRVGYSSSQAFAAAFRRHVGATPVAYRRSGGTA